MFLKLKMVLMNLSQHIEKGMLKLKVVPNSVQTKLIEDEQGQLKLYLQAVPDKNKANTQLIKFFKKEFGLKIRIKSGTKSREKVLMVL